MTSIEESFEVSSEPVVSGLGQIKFTVDNEASQYSGKKKFLAIYEECANYQLIGNGLLGTRRNVHTASLLITAELSVRDAIELARKHGDAPSEPWITATNPGDYMISTSGLYVKTTNDMVRLFYVSAGNHGAFELWPQSETDLERDYDHSEMLPNADLKYLLDCPFGAFRRTHPNWTFIRVQHHATTVQQKD